MKKILISLLSIIFIISMFSCVYAATGSITSGASSDTVVKGKTFTVTLAATADSPIDGMGTDFTYDKNVLVLESKVAGENYGDSSAEGEIFVSYNVESEAPKSAQLYTLTFKVLETANVDSTSINFSNSELHLKENEDVKKFSTEIDKVEINIKSDDTTVDNKDDQNNVQEETKNNTTTPSNTTGSGNKSTGSSSSNNTTKKTTKLPQTGVESVSIIAIIALGVIGIASYVSYRKYKNI